MMKKENQQKREISVHCGKVTDSFEKLEALCREEADRLSLTMDVPEGQTVSAAFWTGDFPELICVGTFRRKDDGMAGYDLDFSESTL